MMRSIPLMPLIAALTMSTFGCGDDNGTIPLDQVAGKIAAANCEQIFRCCDAAERMQQFQIFDPPPTTEAECTTTFAAFVQAFLVNDEAIAAGRIEYDAAAAADCLAAIDGAACGSSMDDATVCDRVFVGRVPAGGMCKDSDECVGEADCDGATADTLGNCVALATVGQSCATQSCVDGAWCDFASDMCTADKANGMPCSFRDECVSDFCDATDTCADQPASMTCDGV